MLYFVKCKSIKNHIKEIQLHNQREVNCYNNPNVSYIQSYLNYDFHRKSKIDYIMLYSTTNKRACTNREISSKRCSYIM